jgi:hypothetical protein
MPFARQLQMFRQQITLCAVLSLLMLAPGRGQAQTNNPLSVSLSSPTNGEAYTAPASIQLLASMVDSNTVATVQYFANGASLGTRTNLVGGLSTKSTIVNPFFLLWTNVMAGSYSITAVATDVARNVATSAPVSVVVAPSTGPSKAVLALITSGPGLISGEKDGAILVVGKTYSVAATPRANCLFSNWLAGTNGGTLAPVTNAPRLSFVMVPNLVIQANFATNPFNSFAGMFSGLFFPASGATVESSGFISVTISTSSRGVYSGKLLLDGGSYAFKGTFDLTGHSQNTIARAGKTSIALSLYANPTGANDILTGSVSGEGSVQWASPLFAYRSYFSQATTADSYAGKYTMLVPPGESAPTNEPGGYGCLTLKVDAAGHVALAGQLADGTTLSQSVPVSRTGRFPVYAPLYSGHGLFLGWLTFEKLATQDPPQIVLCTNVAWIKPAGTTTIYPGGFDETNIDLMASSYTTPKGGKALNLTNATLAIANANLGSDLVFSNLVITGNKITDASTNGNPTNHLALTVVAGTGMMSLTFRPTGAAGDTVAHGIVMQADMPLEAAGWFFDANHESQGFVLSQ